MINKNNIDGDSSSSSMKNVIKGMFTLFVGAGIGRVVGIISMPVIARFYSPNDYGILALYVSSVAIISPMLTFRYVQAVPLPKKDAMAINIISLCIKLIFIWSLVISILFYYFSDFIFSLFNAKQLINWWWMIIIGSVGVAIYEVLSLWSTRKKHFRTMSKSQVSQSIIGNLTKIILGVFSIKPFGLILGQFLNQSSGVVWLFLIVKNDLYKLKKHIKIKNELVILLHYKDFLIYRFPSHLLMVISIQAPLLMSALLYEKSITGQLSLAIMVLSLPSYLIGHAMARAFYSEIAGLGKNNLKIVKEVTIRLQKKLFMISIPFAILIAICSEFAFTLVFGQDWILAGKFAAILSPFIMFQFTSSPLMEVINVVGKQHYFLILHTIRFLGLIVIFNVMKILELSDIHFVFTISAYLSAFYLFASLLVINTIRREANCI